MNVKEILKKIIWQFVKSNFANTIFILIFTVIIGIIFLAIKIFFGGDCETLCSSLTFATSWLESFGIGYKIPQRPCSVTCEWIDKYENETKRLNSYSYFKQDESWISRDFKYLEQINETLYVKNKHCVIQGSSGIGKTTLATQYSMQQLQQQNTYLDDQTFMSWSWFCLLYTSRRG